MAELNDLSTSAASNTARFPEAMARSQVNNSARELEAILARADKDNNGSLTTGGTSTAYTVTLNSQHAAWFTGLKFRAKLNATCGATPTINPTGSAALGAKSLYFSDGTQVTTGYLVSGGMYDFVYDGTNVQVTGVQTPVAAASETVAGKAELATQTETNTGTDDARIVTPLKLKSLQADYFTNKVAALPRSYLAGLGLANNGSDATNDIDIAVGECRDSTNAKNIVLASALTKRLDASWAVGTNQGGLDTGVIANDVYHLWLIMRSDTGVVDALFSASATSPTMPANYDYKRRIGAIIRSGATILAFSQWGDEFLLSTAVVDADATSTGTSAVLRTLTVPDGISVQAIVMFGYYAGTSGGANYLSSPDQSDQAPSAYATAALSSPGLTVGGNNAHWIQTAGRVLVRTNTSAQVRTRSEASGAANHVGIVTYGWIDRRGRDD